MRAVATRVDPPALLGKLPIAGRSWRTWASSEPTSSATPRGGAIALQVALDAPEVVHSLVQLEPGLLDVPKGTLLEAAIGPAIQLYEAGEREAATDGFCRWAIGPAYGEVVDRMLPWGYAQAVADADTFFSVELPSLQTWRFTRGAQ